MITEEEISIYFSPYMKDENLLVYGDHADWEIIPRNKERTAWALFSFSEVNGDIWFIKRLADLTDLKNVIFAITNKELLPLGV